MANYLVRKGKFTYEVAKFEESNTPVGVYRITSSRCDCPARTRKCKHISILKAWESAGKVEGSIISDDARVVGNIFEGLVQWM